MSNDYIFKVRTDGDIVDLEGRVIGHINLEYIKTIAERPQGKWIFGECSICGKFINKVSNYCPNCGSRMQKGGEKNDT